VRFGINSIPTVTESRRRRFVGDAFWKLNSEPPSMNLIVSSTALVIGR
jgi:hypothetical protein